MYIVFAHLYNLTGSTSTKIYFTDIISCTWLNIYITCLVLDTILKKISQEWTWVAYTLPPWPASTTPPASSHLLLCFFPLFLLPPLEWPDDECCCCWPLSFFIIMAASLSALLSNVVTRLGSLSMQRGQKNCFTVVAFCRVRPTHSPWNQFWHLWHGSMENVAGSWHRQ